MAADARPVALVGRDAELGVLRTLVAEVAAGRGGAVWVAGEPGIGKSALVREGIAGAAEAGCAVFWGSGDRSRRGFPLGVMLDCLGVDGRSSDPVRAQVVRVLRGEGMGEVVPAGDPAAAAAEMVCELVDRLCAVSPVVMVVDDMHWVDEASVSVWHRLVGGVGSMPLLVVGMARPVPRSAAVQAARRAVRDEGVFVELGRLTDDEVAAMMEGLTGGVPGSGLVALARRAEGNPLYVRELIDALVREDRVRMADGVAEMAGGAEPGRRLVSLAAAIEDRVGFMPKRAVEFLRVAALLGERFSVTDVAVVQGYSVRELAGVVQESVTAGVLTESGDELAFRHGLIRQALVDGMPVSLRVGLHREAARTLADAGAPEETVAAQLLAAAQVGTRYRSNRPPSAGQAQDGWVVGWLAANAQVLLHRAPTVAAGLLEQAVSAAEADDSRRQVLEEALAGAYLLLGRHEQAEGVARRLLAATSDPERRARMAWTVAYALLYMSVSGIDQAFAVVDKALNDPSTSRPWAARLRAIRALLVVSYGGDSKATIIATAEPADEATGETAAAMAQAALADAEWAGDRFAAGYALHALSIIRGFAGDDVAFLDTVERGLTVIGDDPETTDLRLLLMANRLTSMSRLGRDTETETRELLALAERVGTARMATARLALCQYLFDNGRWDDALAEVGPLFEPGANVAELDLLASHGLAAMIAVYRDDQAGLERHLVVSGPTDLPGNNPYIAELTRARALAAERAGRSADAAEILVSAARPEYAMDLDQRVLWLPDLVRCALAGGDPGAARAAVQVCEEEARGGRVGPSVLAAVRQCAGLIDNRPEPIVEAVTCYRAMSRPARPARLAQALEDLSVVYGSGGALAEARAALREAADIYTKLGAEWGVMRADIRSRPYGVRRRRQGSGRQGAHRPVTGWGALTPTETKIAYLVAEGLSNPDIGARLFLSWRTVRFHVSSIMAKLGVHSRVEVAREAARHPRTGTTG